MDDAIKTLEKVRSWANGKKGVSRYVAGDTNVTYEDVLKLCDLADPLQGYSDPEDSDTEEDDEDVYQE